MSSDKDKNIAKTNTFSAFDYTFTYEHIKTVYDMNYITITFENCCIIESKDAKRQIGTFYESIVFDDCFVPDIYFN
jgi:hypothetical protein